MRRHKTVALVILILSIANFVLAAPASRRIHEARDGVFVPVLANDVRAVAEKRGNGNAFGMSVPLEHAPPEDSEWSDSESDHEGYMSASEESSDLSSTSGESSGHSPTLSELPDDSPTSTEPLVPNRPPSRNRPMRPKIMTPEKIKATAQVAAAGLFLTAILGIVDFHVSLTNSSNSSAS